MITSETEARGWIEAVLQPSPVQWQQLERYAAMLVAANASQNLLAASTIPALWVRHIADSAQLLAHDRRDGDGLWLDLGSGPGLPGLVAAILSERPVWLVESRALRSRFLAEVIDALDLAGRVTVQPLRLERVAATAAATISARAFAPLPRLIDLSARFSTATTRWLLPKGQNAAKELALLTPAWHKLFHVEQSLTDAASGIIIGTGTVQERQKNR